MSSLVLRGGEGPEGDEINLMCLPFNIPRNGVLYVFIQNTEVALHIGGQWGECVNSTSMKGVEQMGVVQFVALEVSLRLADATEGKKISLIIITCG